MKDFFSDEYRGDVFIFDLNGKIYSSFNQKNGLGYTVITSVIFDKIEKKFLFSRKMVLYLVVLKRR